jgi:hypothetical protein
VGDGTRRPYQCVSGVLARHCHARTASSSVSRGLSKHQGVWALIIRV